MHQFGDLRCSIVNIQYDSVAQIVDKSNVWGGLVKKAHPFHYMI